ncbi:hypothetical protein CRG98_029306 [Punica granatum]|uniref:Fe2OG dioxygenase domain-containing protein n=1 Tax=Punica granatum TaxID=22663 RepID=A0A2I0J2E7_PUNGR|nr:hypothetical protein CRG98_029306 [Punica granatum]
MGEVDPAFIQDIDHQHKVVCAIAEAKGIPLIDLSALINSPDDCQAIEGLVAEVRSASKEWGFFLVINHGVPLEKLRRLEEAARKFFGQPLEEKRKVRRDEVSTLGYYDTEHTKNVRDWKEVFDFTLHDPTLIPASYTPDDEEVTQWSNKWPENLPELRLMELIALSLGLPADRFHGFFNDHQTTFMRLNHYPPCPAPHLALGVGHHKDSGALTVLAQDDVGGLEVRRKSDGEWIRVKPIPNAYIINIGDIIQPRAFDP